jgi:hypothetical protein
MAEGPSGILQRQKTRRKRNIKKTSIKLPIAPIFPPHHFNHYNAQFHRREEGTKKPKENRRGKRKVRTTSVRYGDGQMHKLQIKRLRSRSR